MKKWISIVPAAALILGAAACERSDYVAQEQRTANEDARVAADAAAKPDARPAPAVNPAPGMPNAPANQPAGMPQAAPPSDHQTLTGTMDVQDEDARTFILEGNAQTYTAPQQADLGELDGEQVTVILDANGRVITIEPESDREG